jgi:large subunit ribosomal protein L9
MCVNVLKKLSEFNKQLLIGGKAVEVILLEKMRNLGALGDMVKVKPGFARNYLIPQSKAVFANKENIAKFEQRRAELEKIAAEKHQQALARQKIIMDVGVLTILAKVGEEGKLFGSIGTRDIVDALNLALGKTDVTVEKHEVQLSEGTLRHLGEYDITLDLESDITATVKVNVVAES